jgi:hypothetical protein
MVFGVVTVNTRQKILIRHWHYIMMRGEDPDQLPRGRNSMWRLLSSLSGAC